MKQKLLNLFTWRATLLVALLCTSFGNAWADDWTQNIVFAESETIAKGGTQTFTSDEFTGYLRSVVINHDKPNGQVAGSVTISFNGVNVSVNGNLDFEYNSNHVYEYTYAADGDTKHGKNATIKVTITNTGKKDFTVNSITVTYTPTTSITLSPNCYDVDENNEKTYYGTYSNSKPFVVPDRLTVHTVSANADGELAVIDYNATTTVPGGTGVMVSSSEAGEKIVKMANPNPTSPYSALSGNMLKPTDDDGITAEAMAAANSGCKFYYLTMNGDQIGFYRRNDTGSAFAMPANKAYLAVPTTTPAPEIKGFAFGDGTNGIKAVETEKAESNAIYTLAGQRVSKMQKGLYIVNGKKMIQR